MLIIRKYIRINWFDFLDLATKAINSYPKKESYIEFLDEIKMRKLESVSEGGNYKYQKFATFLLEKFEARLVKEESFASEKDLDDFKKTVDEIIK